MICMPLGVKLSVTAYDVATVGKVGVVGQMLVSVKGCYLSVDGCRRVHFCVLQNYHLLYNVVDIDLTFYKKHYHVVFPLCMRT